MARLYAQRALGRMWEDCEEEKLVSVLHHFLFVKELVEFMEVTGYVCVCMSMYICVYELIIAWL